MSSADFDTYLCLSNETVEILADDDDGGEDTSPKIFSSELPSTETFAIEATPFKRWNSRDLHADIDALRNPGMHAYQLWTNCWGKP